MYRTFSDTMKEMRGLINEWSAPVLLAVSGGIDSMCMAELFASLEDPVPFAVAHCNFNLRGEESDADEELVRRWASGHGVQIHVTSFDTVSYAMTHGISIEMAARDLRYSWFASLCARYGYKAVAVAHNANDNAETLMLNLLRGAGLHGLSGMSKVSVLPCEQSVFLLRPLLDCTRKQIEGHMFAHKAEYREDSTNASSEYKRNRIRNEVFPIFETVNPSFVRTFNREMRYFAEAEEIVDDWCRSAAPSVTSRDGARLTIAIRPLMQYRHWRYLLYHILEPYGFGSAVLASLEELLVSSRTVSGKRFESREYVLLTGRDVLDVFPASDEVMQKFPALGTGDAVMPVRGAGTYNFNGRKFKVEVLERADVPSLRLPEGVLMMDAGKLRFPFVLRRWRTGDWMIPFGMRGKKKISDFFADRKFDAVRKSEAVMIVDTMSDGMAEDQHVAGVACIRIDNIYRITDDTSSIIRITEL